MELLALASATARRLGEIGFLVGALGALLLAFGATRSDSGGIGQMARLIGPALIAVGFVLGIVYIHWA
ncbi:MAG TPA: hypothetical protein VN799_01400 [Acidimicrobiales bacterium]|nr:hypothetical protein [Acidimicrobiales bacterium]